MAFSVGTFSYQSIKCGQHLVGRPSNRRLDCGGLAGRGYGRHPSRASFNRTPLIIAPAARSIHITDMNLNPGQAVFNAFEPRLGNLFNARRHVGVAASLIVAVELELHWKSLSDRSSSRTGSSSMHCR
jgi:hypothetical protein